MRRSLSDWQLRVWTAGSPDTQPSGWWVSTISVAPSADRPCSPRPEGWEGGAVGQRAQRGLPGGDGTGGEAWVLRAHSGTWRGAAGSSVGAASGQGTAQTTALAKLLLLPGDLRGGPGAASVSIPRLLCWRPAVWTRIPVEQAGLQQSLGVAGPQGPLETHACLPETRLCVGLEPPLGSFFLNSDRCPCGVRSRRVLSAMSRH